MPIKHIVDAVESYCSLEIAERFLAGPCANIPIAPIIGGPRTRKQCFHNVLPTKMGTELIVEIQTKWQYEQDGSPRHALQLDLIRQLYWSSITAMPFRLGAS